MDTWIIIHTYFLKKINKMNETIQESVVAASQEEMRAAHASKFSCRYGHEFPKDKHLQQYFGRITTAMRMFSSMTYPRRDRPAHRLSRYMRNGRSGGPSTPRVRALFSSENRSSCRFSSRSHQRDVL